MIYPETYTNRIALLDQILNILQSKISQDIYNELSEKIKKLRTSSDIAEIVGHPKNPDNYLNNFYEKVTKNFQQNKINKNIYDAGIFAHNKMLGLMNTFNQEYRYIKNILIDQLEHLLSNDKAAFQNIGNLIHQYENGGEKSESVIDIIKDKCGFSSQHDDYLYDAGSPRLSN